MSISCQKLDLFSPSGEGGKSHSSVPYVHSSIHQLLRALEALELNMETSVLVVTGGASQISKTDFDCIRHLFQEMLAPVEGKVGLTVIDGGTDSGIMQLMGEARSSLGYQFPLLGIAPANLNFYLDRIIFLKRVSH